MPSAAFKELIQGNVLTLFAFLFVYFAIGIGAGFSGALIPQPHLRMLISVFIQIVMNVLYTAALVVLYFSCRCRHENFDLVHLVHSVGAPESEAASRMANS